MDNPRILIAPLDWGLGHTTRIIPVIQAVLDNKAQPIIAGNKTQIQFLQQYFPDEKYVHLEGYNVKYRNHAGWDVALQTPRILQEIRKERQACAKWVGDLAIDAIVSDNRYGMHHESVPSIIITHQLTIPGPKIAQAALRNMLHKHLAPFNHIWIPDCEGEQSLAGTISQSTDSRARYIGPLSRFSRHSANGDWDQEVELLGIVSGPETMRTEFENELINLFQRDGRKAVIARGNMELPEAQMENVHLIPHLADAEMRQAIQNCKHVICRSGYSTIMDLAFLKRKAMIVPTPGQHEQVHLAEWLAKEHGFSTMEQREIKSVSTCADWEPSDWPIQFETDLNAVRQIIQQFTA